MNINGGLGCKSPLAYTDHFWIETWTVEDSKNIYRKWVQYIDSTKVGALTLLEEKEEYSNNFLTGTKVSVPFNEKDFSKIVESLSLYLTYTKTKFKILNPALYSDLTLIKPFYNYYGENWALKLSKSFSYGNKDASHLVVLYDIPYKLDLNLLYSYLPNFKDLLVYNVSNLRPSYINKESNLSLFNGFLETLKQYSFEVNLPIGSVDVSASRETLQYTEKTCIEVYKYLYKMFIEFYQNLRIDLIHHPNLIEACYNYELYPNDLKSNFLNKLFWEKGGIKFLSRYSIMKTSSYITENIKQYRLDNIYRNKKGNFEKVLKKVDTESIYPGSYKYILCIQNTSYKNYSKYVKYHLQKLEESTHRRIHVICVEESSLPYIQEWLREGVPTIYLSDLITNYDNNHTKEVTKKTNDGFFKCLRFYSNIKRSRAIGVNAYLEESVTRLTPKNPQYYLSQEDVDNLPEDFKFIPHFKVNDKAAYVFIDSLNNYLQMKKISINDLFYTNKANKNFKHSNWINILDIIKEDYKIYKASFKACAIHVFNYNYVRQHKTIFNLFEKEDLLLEHSLYNYIASKADASRLFLKENKFLVQLMMLIKPDIYFMSFQLDKSHLNAFTDFAVPEEIKEECLEFYTQCNDYTSTLPFLQIHGCSYFTSTRNFINLDKDSFLFYINVMEKELNLTKKLEETIVTSNSEFFNLVNKLESKFLVRQGS